MKKDDIITEESRTSFLKGILREEDLDELTFDMWKDELRKELPGFWEQMNTARRKF